MGGNADKEQVGDAIRIAASACTLMDGMMSVEPLSTLLHALRRSVRQRHGELYARWHEWLPDDVLETLELSAKVNDRALTGATLEERALEAVAFYVETHSERPDQAVSKARPMSSFVAVIPMIQTANDERVRFMLFNALGAYTRHFRNVLDLVTSDSEMVLNG